MTISRPGPTGDDERVLFPRRVLHLDYQSLAFGDRDEGATAVCAVRGSGVTTGRDTPVPPRLLRPGESAEHQAEATDAARGSA